MKETVPVHERQARQYLKQNNFDCVFREVLIAVFNQLVKILLHVFKDEVENVIFPNHFLQLDDIRV